MNSADPIIRFEGVHKHFGRLHVLNDINLTVQPGEKVVLLGSSGCGKSTLLRCINALESVSSGTLVVNGVDLSDPVHRGVNINAFRAGIGMVFQQFNLFPHLSVLDNITLAPVKVKRKPKAEAEAQARTLLAKVDLADKAHAYPEQLSGGQQQRVAIARCLAMEPTVLLLDEPTSALDPPMTREVLSVIRGVAEEGMTLVIVTHEVGFARQVADRAVFMSEGKILEAAPPDALFTRPVNDSTRQYLESVLHSQPV